MSNKRQKQKNKWKIFLTELLKMIGCTVLISIASFLITYLFLIGPLAIAEICASSKWEKIIGDAIILIPIIIIAIGIGVSVYYSIAIANEEEVKKEQQKK